MVDVLSAFKSDRSGDVVVLAYFAEFDAYTSAWRGYEREIEAARRALVLSSLLADLTVFPPSVLLRHPVALPAIAALRPLMRANAIGVSGDPTRAESPLAHLQGRASESLLEFGSATVMRGVRARQHRLLDENLALASSLLPSSWILQRSVRGQEDAFGRDLLSRLEPARDTSKGAGYLLDGVLDRGRVAKRDVLLADLAKQRGMLTKQDLAYWARAIQGGYLAQGLEGIRAATSDLRTYVGIFPGPGATRFFDTTRSEPRPLLPLGRLLEAVGRHGVSADSLLALPAELVVAVRESPAWRTVRASVFGRVGTRDLAHALDEVRQQVNTAAPRARSSTKVFAPRSTVSVPLEQLQVLAEIGYEAASLDVAPSHGWTFDIVGATIVRLEDAREVRVAAAHVGTVSLMLAFGNVGIAVEDLVRLEDSERRDKKSGREPADALAREKRHAREAQHATLVRNRIQKRIEAIADALADIGLDVEALDGGRYRISQSASIRVTSTWSLPFAPTSRARREWPEEARATPSVKALWTIIEAHGEHGITLGALTLAFYGSDTSELRRITTSQIGNLRKALAESGTCRIDGPRGVYRIV